MVAYSSSADHVSKMTAVAFKNADPMNTEPADQNNFESKRLRVVELPEGQKRPGRLNWLAASGAAPFQFLSDVAAVSLAGFITSIPIWAIAIFVAATTFVLQGRGMYRPWLNQAPLNWLPKMFLNLGAPIGATAMTIMFAGDVIGFSTFSIRQAMATLALATGFAIVGRMAIAAAVHIARSRGDVSLKVLVLGAGVVGADLVQTMRNEPKYGLEPVGYYDPSPATDVDMPTFDPTRDIMNVIEDLGASAVVVAFSSMNDSTLVPILRACDRMSCEIFVVPRLFELMPSDPYGPNSVGTTNLVRLPRASHRSGSWRAKRIFDIVVTSIGVFFLSPLLAFGAIGSLIENGRPILFRQERVGLDGRRFEILKFTSMRPVDETESQSNWNIGTDDRVGPISRILRKFSIDELPQLWNVLKGDMSLVGPRPERPHFVDQFSDEIDTYEYRHRVPAGLTGLAQIQGLRGDTSISERARYDNAYIEGWSFARDMKILLRTVAAVVLKPGS